MPVYLITDKLNQHRVMVEAGRPQTALAEMVADRFDVTDAVSAADALRFAKAGVPFLETAEAEEEAATDEPAAEEPTADRAGLEAFERVIPDDDDPDFSEVEEASAETTYASWAEED